MPKVVKKAPPKKSAPKKVVKKISKKAATPKKVNLKVIGKKTGLKVPTLKLYNGKKIPVVGLGTFGSDHMPHERIGEAVKYAIENGYRLIDCAKVYCNESFVGKALKAVIKDGHVRREDLIIISKLANQDHDQVEKACRKTLKDL